MADYGPANHFLAILDSEDNTYCQTCHSRKEAFNGGIGAHCTTNGQCPQTGGTCNATTLLCNDNTDISCTVATEATDCNGLGAVCDTTDTCNLSCRACPAWAG